MEFRYGSEHGVDNDVELFQAFYLQFFKQEACEKMLKRARFRYASFAVLFAIAGLLLGIPMLINARSVFAVILLIFGLAALAAAVFFAIRFIRAADLCRRNFEKLMESEFAAARTLTKRVFDISFGENEMTVVFGVATGVIQRRSRRYEDIAAVYETPDLVYIKGLTWMTRGQLGEERYRAVCSLLQCKCGTYLTSTAARTR